MPIFTGTSGDDALTGGAGADTIDGLGGNDVLHGGDGNDTIDGGAGQDQSFGDDGDDLLIVSAAPVAGEVYNGGTGTDTLRFLTSAGSLVTTLTGPLYQGGFTSNTLSSIERLEFGSIAGTSLSLLFGMSQIGAGLAATAELVGGDGNDLLRIVATVAGTYTMPSFTYSSWTNADEAFEQGDSLILIGFGNAAYTLNAAAGHLGIQTLVGGNGNDTLNGTDGLEVLFGGDGLNMLNAAGGDDVLVAANTTPFGGVQTNFIYFNNVFNGGAGFDWLSVGGFVDFRGSLVSIEGINFQAAFTATGAGTASQEVGELEIDAAAFDVLPATLNLRGTGFLEIQLAPGTGFDGSQWVHLPGSNVAIDIHGTDGSEVMVGTSGNDRLASGLGSDTLTGGAGVDEFEAGDGQHTVTDFTVGVDRVDLRDMDITSFAQAQFFLSQVGANVVFSRTYGGVAQTMTLLNVNLASLTADSFAFQVGNEDDTRIGTDFADDLIGAGGADDLQGLGGNDRLFSGDGNDLLDGGAGDDSVDGGAGLDIASYVSAGAGVTVSLALQGGGQNTLGAGTDTLIGIENLTGSGFNDTLTGNGGGNTLSGGAGNDVLNGGAGIDTMIGGLGDDRYYIDAVGDVATEAAGEGDDIAFVLGTYTLAQGTSIETLYALDQASTDPLILTGNEFGQSLYGNLGDNYLNGGQGNDFLVGSGGNDSLLGGTGNDHLAGGTGNDVYYVDSQGDLVTELAGEGDNDLLVATVSYALGSGASIETMSAEQTSANLNLTGNELAQSIYGNAGDNIITGGGGADYLVGGAGNDRYYVDTSDFIAESNGGGDDWIFVADTYILREGNEIETLVAVNQDSTAPVNLTGNEYGQSLYGSQGANSLNGGAGNDYLVGLGGNDFLLGGDGNDNLDGGAGNDVYYVDGGDQVFEAAGQGEDIAVAFASFTLNSGAHVETLSAAEGSAAINLTGNEQAQTLFGNAGANVLNGGGGNDYLIGGQGNDRFVFTGLPGNDAIADFTSGADKLDLTAFGITQSDVQATSSNGNTSLAIDTNHDGTADFTITLVGAGAPAAGDYLF